MITFWYCFDDTLAKALGIPGLGHIPFWVWAVLFFPRFTLGIISALGSAR